MSWRAAARIEAVLFPCLPVLSLVKWPSVLHHPWELLQARRGALPPHARLGALLC